MGKKTLAVRSHDINLDVEYREWITEVKQRFKNCQIKAAVKVNSEAMLFNWQLGRDLVIRRAEERWGRGVVEQVSLDLQAAFPGAKGFSTTNLWYMKKWYQFYAEDENKHKTEQLAGDLMATSSLKLQQVITPQWGQKLQQVVGELGFPSVFCYVPWGHHVAIITKCKSVEEAFFYIRKTIENNWSRSALDDNLRADYYHVSGGAVTNFRDSLPEPQGRLAIELLRENYDLGFINLPEGYNEKDLEKAIEQRMTRFLLELGDGWAFVGRQKEIVVAGKTRKIDMLFYHIYLRCYVVIELKVRPFEPEFAGKLNFYVNAVNMLIRRKSDNPTVGLLICRDMDHTEVQMTFQGITTPMGVATYDNIRIEQIRKHLPTTEQIKAVIEQAEEEYAHIRKTAELL